MWRRNSTTTSLPLTLFMTIVKAIPKIVIALVKALPSIIKAIIDGLISLPVNLWNNVLSPAISKFSDFASYARDKAAEAGRNFLTNVIEHIKELPGKVKEKVDATIEKVRNFVGRRIRVSFSGKNKARGDKYEKQERYF